MSGFDDLGPALRDDAQKNAPRAHEFDVDALARAARARRAPRLWGAGALGVVAVLGLGSIALALPGLSAPILLADGMSGADESATFESAEDGGGGRVADEEADLVDAALCGTSLGSLHGTGSSSTVTLTLGDLAVDGNDDSSIDARGVLQFENAGQNDVTLEGYGALIVAIVDDLGTIVATSAGRDAGDFSIDVPAGVTTTLPFTSLVTPCDATISFRAGDDLAVVAVYSTLVSETEAVEVE